jgi:hypothetical protein
MVRGHPARGAAWMPRAKEERGVMEQHQQEEGRRVSLCPLRLQVRGGQLLSSHVELQLQQHTRWASLRYQAGLHIHHLQPLALLQCHHLQLRKQLQPHRRLKNQASQPRNGRVKQAQPAPLR